MKKSTPTKPIKRERGVPNIDRTVQSPCISVCLLDETESFCIGCFRTIIELRDWCIMTAEQKTRVLKEIEERKTN